jgi:putative oxidoreductase
MISRHIDSTIGPLILRLTLGVTMLIAHGLPKLINFAAKSNTFPDPLGISPKLSLTLTVLAEVVCAICIILGAKVRLSSIPLIIAMAVAAFVVHAGQPWHRQELAFIYLFGFITLFFTGPGKFALKE